MATSHLPAFPTLHNSVRLASLPTATPTVLEINSAAELAQYRLTWDSLLQETRDASHFQSLDWLLTYWRHYGADQKLRVLIVESAGSVIGILPLVVRREQTKVGTVRVLTYPLHGWGSFYGPIGPNPTATLMAGLRYLQSQPKDWDMLDLRWVDADGVDCGRTRQAMKQVGWFGGEQPWMQSAQIDLSNGWDAYWGTRKTKWKSNIRRMQRKLQEAGKLELVRYRPEGTRHGDDDLRLDLYRQCEELARRSWQGSSTSGTTLSHESVATYLRDAYVAAVRAGGVELCLLTLNGQPIAFAFNYHRDGRVYGVRAGYDPQFSNYGVGSVFQMMMLEDSALRGDVLFDLGPGALDCKKGWQTRLQNCYRYTYYNRGSLQAQALRVKHWLTRKFSSDPTVNKQA